MLRRVIVRRWLRVVLNAPLIGGIYMVGLLAYVARDPIVPADEVLLGKDAKEISNHVAVHFAHELHRIEWSLGVTAIVVGVTLGLVAHALLRVRGWIRGQELRHPLLYAAEVLGIIAVLHAMLLSLSMSRWPQLYTASFWTRGGVLAAIQRTVTDRLGVRGLALLCMLLGFLFLAGGPRAWTKIVTRVHSGLAVRPFALVIMSLGFGAALGLAPDALVETRPKLVLPPESAPTPRRPSVLVLAADGLRDDHLRAELAPRLTHQAGRGVRFERAYVDVARTLDSWTTILTGLHPHHHGLRSGHPRWEDVQSPFATVPASLRSEGYVTAAVSDYAGDVFHQADFGLSYVDVPPVSFPTLLEQVAIQRSVPLLPFLQSRPGRVLFPAIESWSGAADPEFVADDAVSLLRDIHERPFFLIVFFSTTHFPYAAPSPYHARYTNPSYTGPFRYDKIVTAGVPTIPKSEDILQIRGLYKGAVSAVDAAAGRVLDEITRLGIDDRTIVMITADHGETLFEHDRWHGHGDHLFGDESTHIPLAIYDPRHPIPRTEPALVSSVDIAPTLHDLLGVPPRGPKDGRSLAAGVRGEPLASRPVFAESGLGIGMNPGVPSGLRIPPLGLNSLFEVDTDHDNRVAQRKSSINHTLLARQRMVRDERWKLIYIPTSDRVVYQLFDVQKDPDELHDVYADEPDVAARLKDLLWSWMLEDPRMTRDGEFLVPKGTSAPGKPTP